MAATSVTPEDLQTQVVDPNPPGSEQQHQIAAVTNGGASIVPNSINDGPLVHMGMYPSCIHPVHADTLTRSSAQDARHPPYRGQILAL